MAFRNVIFGLVGRRRSKRKKKTATHQHKKLNTTITASTTAIYKTNKYKEERKH